jgi:hypothetical protein
VDWLADPEEGGSGAAGKEDHHMIVDKASGTEDQEQEEAARPQTEAEAEAALKLW